MYASLCRSHGEVLMRKASKDILYHQNFFEALLKTMSLLTFSQGHCRGLFMWTSS